MIETFKIITGIYDKRVTKDIFHLSKSTITRGNTYRLEKHRSARDLRKYSFTNKVVYLWNSLPDTIVTFKTINKFENRLDKYWENHQMKFDYNSEYGPPTGRKTVNVEEDDEEELGSSDHCAIEFNYRCYFSYDQTKNERLNYYKANYDEMRKELDIDWEKELGDSNPIEMLNKVMEKLNKTIDKNIPKSKPRNTKGSIHLSKETVQNIKRKHRLWERYMEDRSKEKHREYCKARNKVKRLTRRGRKEREKQVAESAKTNSKNFWKFVNSKRKTKTGVSELTISQSLVPS
jgi:hypothetical protein